MSDLSKLQSTYALIDVMRGRKKLLKHLEQHGPVKVMIEATITERFGQDDGTSIEFCADVTKIQVLP